LETNFATEEACRAYLARGFDRRWVSSVHAAVWGKRGPYEICFGCFALDPMTSSVEYGFLLR